MCVIFNIQIRSLVAKSNEENNKRYLIFGKVTMMKTKKNVKRTRVIAIVLCGCLLLSGAATVFGAQAVDGVLFEGGYLRAIKANYLEEEEGKVSADSLEPNSKWREEPLKSQLSDALNRDLTNRENYAKGAQEWKFTAEEYEKAREWCLEHPKGEETNEAFLNPENFGGNRVYEKE